jgi:putative nucleotidyltransferase with HDIG domain
VSVRGLLDGKVNEESVRETLVPELDLIRDVDLKVKAVKAWTLACQMGGYERLEDVPTEAFEWLPNVSNIQHQKDCARIASALAKVLKELGVHLNEDYCVVGALCHDVGKPLEWRNNQPGYYAVRQGVGVFYGKNPEMPSIGQNASYQVARHSVWSFHIAMTVGMPEHLAHIVGAHSREGELLLRSPEAWVVRYADEIWWDEIAKQYMGGYPGGPMPDRFEAQAHARRLDWRKGPADGKR